MKHTRKEKIFISVLGVPNTTQSTEETDVCFSPFKSAFHVNLAFILKASIEQDESVSFSPFLVGLFVFGGVNPASDAFAPRNAFQEGFSH